MQQHAIAVLASERKLTEKDSGAQTLVINGRINLKKSDNLMKIRAINGFHTPTQLDSGSILVRNEDSEVIRIKI